MQPRSPEYAIKSESQWLTMVKKLDWKLKTGLKSQTRHEKYHKDENLENYDSEVQMYAGVRSGPRLAK